jgi:hypothetical protein
MRRMQGRTEVKAANRERAIKIGSGWKVATKERDRQVSEGRANTEVRVEQTGS